MDFKKLIRTIPDFPIEGVLFRDITPVLGDAGGFVAAIDGMAAFLDGLDFDLIVGPEARGFIFGTPLAYRFRKPFVPARKPGKLPHATIGRRVMLEYGETTIELHEDAIAGGRKVIIVDDLLATGGTCKAVCELVEAMGAKVVACVFFIELDNLKGRNLLSPHSEVFSLVDY